MPGPVIVSGGAAGADARWAAAAAEARLCLLIATFRGHTRKGPAARGAKLLLLTPRAAKEADEALAAAAQALGRTLPVPSSYSRRLLRRNYILVRDCDALFGVGRLACRQTGAVSGGTGWAFGMFAAQHKGASLLPMFLFDLDTLCWRRASRAGDALCWKEIPSPPCAFSYRRVACVGSRSLPSSLPPSVFTACFARPGQV